MANNYIDICVPFCSLRISHKTFFLAFSDAQHSETRVSCFPAKERTWLKKCVRFNTRGSPNTAKNKER